MYSGNKSASHNTLGGNTISTTDGTTTHNWQFGVDGRLTFPDATVQTTAYSGQANPDAVVNGSYNITLNATGDFIPNTDNLQALGSPTNRFRHLYVGPGSVYIGDSVISESVSGKLVLPGITTATTLFANEVEETGDQTRTWANPPFLLDAYQFGVASGTITPDPDYSPADYDSGDIDDDGYISEIEVYEPGTWTQAVADYNLVNNMYAFIGTDVQEPHNPSNWVQIPFSVIARANDVEYDFDSGPSDRLVSGDAEVVLASNGDLTIPGVIKSTSGSSYIDPGDTHVVLQTAQDVRWTFASDGELRLPPGADIVDSNGDSVLGVTVLRQDTPPEADNGTLWFNTVEGRIYIKYTDVWVDASPLVMPQPDTDLDVNSVTFADASIQTTAWTGSTTVDRLVNGDNQLSLGTDGTVTFPGGDLTLTTTVAENGSALVANNSSIILAATGESGSTGLAWYKDPLNLQTTGTDLAYVAVGGPASPDKVSINVGNTGEGGAVYTWQFNPNSSTTLPGAIQGRVKSNTYVDTVINLDVTATINKLTPTNGGANYHLADGVEGQIMYIALATGGEQVNEYTLMSFAHARYTNGNGTVNEVTDAGSWLPFHSNTNGSAILTIAFIDGYWTLPHNAFD